LNYGDQRKEKVRRRKEEVQPVLRHQDLRRKENFACVRIFYCGSRRETGDVDVTVI